MKGKIQKKFLKEGKNDRKKQLLFLFISGSFNDTLDSKTIFELQDGW